nr:MAG TPA: hypothetical protein [Caudoviricetes sp.]
MNCLLELDSHACLEWRNYFIQALHLCGTPCNINTPHVVLLYLISFTLSATLAFLNDNSFRDNCKPYR